jgi:hypothetical protein
MVLVQKYEADITIMYINPTYIRMNITKQS